jgi:hypothetical protein
MLETPNSMTTNTIPAHRYLRVIIFGHVEPYPQVGVDHFMVYGICKSSNRLCGGESRSASAVVCSVPTCLFFLSLT